MKLKRKVMGSLERPGRRSPSKETDEAEKNLNLNSSKIHSSPIRPDKKPKLEESTKLNGKSEKLAINSNDSNTSPMRFKVNQSPQRLALGRLPDSNSSNSSPTRRNIYIHVPEKTSGGLTLPPLERNMPIMSPTKKRDSKYDEKAYLSYSSDLDFAPKTYIDIPPPSAPKYVLSPKEMEEMKLAIEAKRTENDTENELKKELKEKEMKENELKENELKERELELKTEESEEEDVEQKNETLLTYKGVPIPDPIISKRKLMERTEEYVSQIQKMIVNDRYKSNFYKRAKLQQENSKRGRLNLSERSSILWDEYCAGYFGSERQAVISTIIRSRCRKELYKAEGRNRVISYWTIDEFSMYVLANEVAVLWAMKDMKYKYKQAMKMIELTVDYGQEVADKVKIEDDLEPGEILGDQVDEFLGDLKKPYKSELNAGKEAEKTFLDELVMSSDSNESD